MRRTARVAPAATLGTGSDNAAEHEDEIGVLIGPSEDRVAPLDHHVSPEPLACRLDSRARAGAGSHRSPPPPDVWARTGTGEPPWAAMGPREVSIPSRRPERVPIRAREVTRQQGSAEVEGGFEVVGVGGGFALGQGGEGLA